MIKIVADHKIPFLQGALDAKANMVYLPGSKISKADVRDADALIVRTRTCCNASLLEGSKVRFIASATIGYDHIDTAYCDAKEIRWTNAPGCNADSVVQYMGTSIAHIIKKEGWAFRDVRLGIIGCGNVGSRLKSMAEKLGMQVWVNDPPLQAQTGNQEFCSLHDLLQNCNIVSLHTPLTDAGSYPTRELADNAFFSKMQKEAWFINTSRGETVCSASLKNALKSAAIRGAVLDVWNREPCPDEELVDLAEISTPHIAGYSADGKAKGTAGSVQAVSKFFGFGLDEWFPGNIPEPKESRISIPEELTTSEEVFHHLCISTHEIYRESKLLKIQPCDFESFREQYRVRREWPAYSIAKRNKYSRFFGAGMRFKMFD